LALVGRCPSADVVGDTNSHFFKQFRDVPKAICPYYNGVHWHVPKVGFPSFR
jgi:hypothetical protein